MTIEFSHIQLGFRFIAALLISYNAFLGLFGITSHGLDPHMSAILPVADDAVHALLVLISVWLILGIRTRMMATFGLVLLAAYTFASSSPLSLRGPEALSLVLLAATAIPLMLYGGGRIALRNGGWSLFT